MSSIAFTSPNLLGMIRRATTLRASPHAGFATRDHNVAELSWLAGHQMSLVITDSVRLTVQTDGEAYGDSHEFVATLSTHALADGIRGLKGPAVCLLDQEAGVLKVSCGDQMREIKTLVADFPNWRRVLPKAHDQEIIIDRVDLERHLKVALPGPVVHRKNELENRVTVAWENGALTIKALPIRATGAGDWDGDLDGYHEIEGPDYEGECPGLSIGFPELKSQLVLKLNGKYLWDALAALGDCPRLRISATSSTTPVSIRAEGYSDRLYILMPITN